MREQKIETEFGTLWTARSTPPKPVGSNLTLLFLHGNSVSSRIFEPLVSSPELLQNHELIVFDYPGHGRSSDAPDPGRSYYQYAYAEAALEVLKHYNVKKVIILGWSLGGHVGLELVSVLASQEPPLGIHIVGIVLTGTPPVPRQQILGFRKDTDLSPLFNPQASDEDLIKLTPYFTKSAQPPAWLVEDLLRTNRSAGQTMVVKFMQGKCSDQVKIVQDFKDGMIAVLNGGAEPVLDLEYCESVCKDAPNLWRGRCFTLENQLHAPFWDDPEGYLALFSRFVEDCKP